MAAHVREERLLTVFADVHYYFNEPSPKPLSHRFDKASYFYLHGNISGSGARLEIANHVGKPEQDAVTGALTQSTIRRSAKQPTLCTVTVEGYRGHDGHASAPAFRPEYHWKLPTADPRSDKKLILHLHTLDIYFWTTQDADSFIEAAQRLLSQDQIELLDYPARSAVDDRMMSPVVQRLEDVAIHSPSYPANQTSNSRGPLSPQCHLQGSDPLKGFDRNDTPKARDHAAFQPLPYNPAAPAAPEPIAHREKTPPPVDGETGTGLAAAAAVDHAQAASPQGAVSRPPYGPSTFSQGYVGGPQSFGAPPTSISPAVSQISSNPSAITPQQSHVSNSSTPPLRDGRSSAGDALQAPRPSAVQSPHSTNSINQEQLDQPQAGQAQMPKQSPATEILGTSFLDGHHQALQHVQPQYPDYLASGHQAQTPLGGYSDYQYRDQRQQQPPQGDDYDIHRQVYRPTEDEYAKKPGSKKAPKAGAGQQNATGRLEERAAKVDTGVNRFFKKLEKKIG